MSDNGAAHSITATAMTQHGSFTGRPEHGQNLLESAVIQSTGPDRNVYVLHAQLGNQRRLVHQSGFHGIPQIEDHVTACLLQCSKLRGIGLTTSDEVRQDLAGIGDSTDRIEGRGHRRREKLDLISARLLRPVHDDLSSLEGYEAAADHAIELRQDCLDLFFAVHTLDYERQVQR